ncbi:MAG: hypothetical protein WDA16_09915 [Candidatus Thermoplasmatota archaeon]
MAKQPYDPRLSGDRCSTVSHNPDSHPRALELAPVVRWFRSILGAREHEAAPLDATERQRFAHRKRAAEREIRQLEKTLKRVGCSTCVQQSPSREAINMERAASALRAEIASIEKRLAAD